MKTVVYIGDRGGLRKELEKALPQGIKLTERIAGGWPVVFFDLDTEPTRRIRDLSERAIVVALTSHKRTTPAMEAAALGAYDVLQRPVSAAGLSELLGQLRAYRRELGRAAPLEHLPPAPTCAIVGHSRAIIEVCTEIARLAQSEAPVLITGETGTGKELIAESIAQMSSRFGKPFVVVNCAAVPEQLLESELFGYERGAFTGAAASKEGMLGVADGGCVFFDEVGELPLSLQGKLLRFLQTQTFFPVGGREERQVNVRVLSATNRDLSKLVQKRLFREDLYYRLRVTQLESPPLRNRKQDIRPLVQFFIDRYRTTAPRTIKGLSPDFLEKLEAHNWPGNIRELENAIRSAVALARTPYLTTFDLREFMNQPTAAGHQPESAARSARERGAPLKEVLSEILSPYLEDLMAEGAGTVSEHLHSLLDEIMIEAALERSGGNHSEAARLLGINRLTLRKKLDRGKASKAG